MRAYLTLSAVIFCGFVGTGAASPFQSLYAASLGAALGQVAFVVGIFSTVGMLSGLLWGRFADRLGRRKPFLIGAMATMALAQLTIADVPSWEWLVPLRALEGAANGAHQVASLALMGDILEGHPHRARMISGYRMSGSLAFSVSIVASGWLAETIGFRGSFLLAAGVYATACAIALTIPERRSGAVKASGARTIAFAELARGPLRPLLVLAGCFGLPFAAVYAVWPIWIANTLGYGRAVYSQLWGLAAFVEVPCMLLCGFLVDRLGARRTFALGLGSFALVYLGYLAAPPLPGLVAAQVVRGFAFAAFTATALTMAIELSPADARGRAAGLYQTANQLAQISGSWVGPPLAAAIGFRPLYGLAAAAVFGAALYSRGTLSRTSSRALAP
ncbi:MAG TPA: MFS transporter [Chloroflexota bacterium]|nr:MFS transporter [Chloroflexota bacterium]